MTEHNFTFVIEGVDPHQPGFEDRLFEAGCDDATIALLHGLVTVGFDREAENLEDAIVSAYADLLSAGVRIVAFEPDDLVTQADIARRGGLTRAAITHYVTGARGAGFPRPVARVTTTSPLWSWAEVAAWLNRHGQLSGAQLAAALIERAASRLFCRSVSPLTSAQLQTALAQAVPGDAPEAAE